MSFYLRGAAVGLAIAAPIGPIGVLCLRRSLADGRVAGFVTGLGAATADAVYGSVAAFGLTAASAWLVAHSTTLRVAGGVFLLGLGVRTFLAAPARTATARGGSLAGMWASTFALTLANPATILSFAAVFAGLGLAGTTGRTGAALALVAGVFSGSALWWLTLSGAAGALRSRFGEGRWINRVSGVVISGFGIAALAIAL